MDVLEEQLQVVLGNWGSETFSHRSEHYVLEDLNAQPKPVQRPHPPLIMGGSGGRRSARLAATYADEYNTPFPTLDDVSQRKALIDAACEKAGRDQIPFSVMTGVAVGADKSEAERRLRARAEKMGADPAPMLADPPAAWITGTIDQATEQLLALREAGVNRVMCQHYVHDDVDMVALIGEELAPRVA
jgi:alkanesulfonate monooxygenase SsuD/methylene tetrahydromethanopterin reductase-like flavin-dependent oxidoreductase (luciferase family)